MLASVCIITRQGSSKTGRRKGHREYIECGVVPVYIWVKTDIKEPYTTCDKYLENLHHLTFIKLSVFLLHIASN